MVKEGNMMVIERHYQNVPVDRNVLKFCVIRMLVVVFYIEGMYTSLNTMKCHIFPSTVYINTIHIDLYQAAPMLQLIKKQWCMAFSQSSSKEIKQQNYTLQVLYHLGERHTGQPINRFHPLQ
jgi:hypothetical protein